MKHYRIKKSNIDRKGRGLYATRNIKEGTRIINYVGKIITKKQTEASEKFDNAKPIYLFNLKAFQFQCKIMYLVNVCLTKHVVQIQVLKLISKISLSLSRRY